MWHYLYFTEEGLAALGLQVPSGRLAEASPIPACLPLPCAGGYAGTSCISTPQLFQFTTQLTEVSKGDIKYQLATSSSWGTSMCLAFVGALNSSGGELKAVSVSTTTATSSVETLEFSAQGRGSILACLQKLTDDYRVLEGVCSCEGPLWGLGLSYLSHLLVCIVLLFRKLFALDCYGRSVWTFICIWTK